MTNRVKATLLGVAASLVGVALWILLYVFADSIASISTILMGILFILVYRKVNNEDQSNYPLIIAGILTVVEIVASEFISLAIICAREGYPLGYNLSRPEVQEAIMKDIGFGLIFFVIIFVAYIFADRKQRQNRRVKDVMTKEKDDDEKRF